MYSFGDTADQHNQYAWFGENTDEVGEDYAHRIGQKLPNSFGLYDMHGSFWESCSDWFEEYPSGAVTAPTGPSSGSRRVNRGGSWYRSADNCRSATHFRNEPSLRGYFGFRVSLTPSGK